MTGGVATGAAAVVLAAVQLLPRMLPHADDVTRRRWLSAAGGFSVAFVFLHLLPELEAASEPVGDALGHLLPWTDHDAHLLALAGLVAFYGLERLARSTGSERAGRRRTISVSIGAFAVYYATVGALLWNRAAEGTAELVTFAIAMALHFLVVDYSLERHHRHLYRSVGRPVLTAGVLFGWILGSLLPLPDQAVGVLLAVLSGAVVLVALKEELPTEAQGRFPWFILGVVLYAMLLFAF